MHKDRLGLIGVPLGVIVTIALFIIPLPTTLISFLIVANMAAALVVVAIALQVKRPLEFSAFPTLLLVATLFRLALNVSVTRLVLLHGYAGVVIASFGNFVVGGSLVVGLVVFFIIIIIQFVVVTNGAGRVAEVAARFTLDAMPGKQMAIDADLNAGLIDTAEARRRRNEIMSEADFYGAMDGASRFVKGDAIAAVVIVAVNLIGGLIVGVVERHLPLGQAVKTYSLLSVGDGLASQIPALLMSVSTGIVVTRAGDRDNDFGHDLVTQVRGHSRAVTVAGGVLVLLGIFPGMPTIPFVTIGLAAVIAGRRLGNDHAPVVASETPDAGPVELTPAAMAAELRVEALELSVARDYVPLLDPAQGGELPIKVRNLRRFVATELGFVVPLVAIKDDVMLETGRYKISVHGVGVAEGGAPLGAMLAIGDGLDQIEGERTTDPVFGLEAVIVAPASRARAVMAGATVLDRTSLLVTHLGEVIRSHAPDLLSLQQVRQLMDVARQDSPAVLEELAAVQVSTGEVLGACRGLLAERVPIRDFVRVLEALANRARVSKDPEGLLEAARTALGPAICSLWQRDGRLAAITLSPPSEAVLCEAIVRGEDGSVLGGDPDTLRRLIETAESMTRDVENTGRRVVLVCSGRLRPALRRLLAIRVPTLNIISIAELPRSGTIDHVGTLEVAVPIGG
jgi:flagellar biosynthesis protein FlhA